MDVEELMNYKPSRCVEDAEEEERERAEGGQVRRARKRKLDAEEPTGLDEDMERLMGDAPPPLDEAGLKRLLLQFERKVLKNQELRIKFSDTPSKFIESEMDLFDVIQEMHVLSTQTELYRVIVDLNIIPTILGLLSHENTDVAVAVVGLLQELSDLDNCDEIEEVTVLMNALIEGQVIAQLVSNMERLDDSVKEEAEGTFNSLAIIENLTDYKPDLSKDAQPLITWILKRFKAKIPFDGNKLYASEILSILIQNNDDNRKLLGSLDGIDTLLQQLAYYKRHDPSSADEHEYMENLFDCLCSSLLCCPANRELFFKGEGMELMNLILREKRKKDSNTSVRMGSLKVLNHVLSADKGKDDILESCCNKFVDILGLRVLFPVLMKPKSIVGGAKKRELVSAVDDIEEHCLSIILALLRFCKTDNKKRIVSKFVETGFEKTERLLELHFKYAEKLIKCDALIKKEKAKMMAADEEVDEDDLFMKRFSDGGLFTLQNIDHIILLLCSLFEGFFEGANVQTQPAGTSSPESIKTRIMKLINLHAATSVNHYKYIKTILREMAEEQKESEERIQILKLVQDF